MDDADARLTQASGTPVRLAGDASSEERTTTFDPLFHELLNHDPDVYTLGDDDPFTGDDPFLSSVLSGRDEQSSPPRLPQPVAASSPPAAPAATTTTTSSGDIATSLGDITSSTGYVFHPAPDVENWRPRERVDYYEAVRQLRFKFQDEGNRPALDAVATHLKELLPIVHFDDPHTPLEVRKMDADQLEARLATLKALPEEGFLPMSRERLVKAVAETEDRLKKLRDGEIPKAAASTSSTAAATDAVAPPASPVSSPQPLTPDQSPNSTFSSVSSSPPTTPRARHKNADQDTVSEAQKIPLGKGDYQTIAKTTTVTTVRRGKRPVVQREHTSTTIPGEGGDDDDDDDGSLGPSTKKTKRVSRAPKTRARRKKQSQQVGSGSAVIDNIHKYIRYLHDRKNEERRKKRKRPP